MRVLFISGTFPNALQPTRGTFNGQTVRALARSHEVVVVAPVSWRDAWRLHAAGQAVPRLEIRDGVPVHHPLHLYPPGVLRSAYEWFFWQSVRPTVREVLSNFRPDIVIGFWVHPDGGTALRISRICGVPGVVMAGGSDVLLLRRNPLRRRCLTRVLRRADAVVCVSHHLKRAVEDLGAPGERVHVVDNGVDPALFSPGSRADARQRLGLNPQAPVLLWVGRMVPVKGLDVLLDAFAASRPHLTSANLCLAGDGPLRQELAARADALGIGPWVRFVGSVPHNELPDWFRAAQATILPSWSEGSPNVLLESMACGTPFIASAVGGVPEIADPTLDRLVPPGDIAALSAAIQDLTRVQAGPSPGRLRCTWDQHAEQLADVFRAAITAMRTPASGAPALQHLAGTPTP
jgi:glycosyltransferase involved in cell wall biosynthesis